MEVSYCNAKILFLIPLCSFVSTDGLRGWTTPFSDTYCSMLSAHKIVERFRAMRTDVLLQVSNNVAILNKPSSILYIGADRGLMLEEQVPSNYRAIRHPTLPLIFEYDSVKMYHSPSNCVKFVVTSEAGEKEEATLGNRSLVMGNGIYNKYYEAKFVSSPKKRSSQSELDVQEQEGELAIQG